MRLTLIREDKKGTLCVTTKRAEQFFNHPCSCRTTPAHEVYPGVEMRKAADGSLRIRRQNGIVVLTVGDLPGQEEREAVRQTTMTLPTTLAALDGADGQSVKILVRYTATDCRLPDDEATADLLAASAYEQAVVTYSRVIDRNIIREAPSARMHFTRPAEMHALYNGEAEPLNMGRYGTETMLLIEQLTARCAFRFNTVMGYTEYRLRKEGCHWQPVDDRVVNGLTMAARLSGLDAWDKDVRRYVQSSMVPAYNPILDFLEKAEKSWDGTTDHIGRLARTVPCDVPQWEGWFRKWLLYMVAQWLGKTRRYGNSVAPLLISEQGNNKSTFCRQLLPDYLGWGYNDNLLISEKKATLQAMSQFLLINLDEFNQISPQIQEGFLKNVIQLARVKIKRPYGKHVEDFPRLASFIATTNEQSVLADPSGNRRFIGIELTGAIDVSQPIDYEGLYGQAVTLINRGEQYWFDDQEVREIMAHNRQFQVKSPAEQWFNECFDIAADESEGQWLTCAAIFTRLKRCAGYGFKGNLNHFGRVLNNLPGLKQRRSNIGKLYLVRAR